MTSNGVSYRDLKVWQKAMELAVQCYAATEHFPKDELYGLTSQMRRCAVSIAANVAEGYGRDSDGSFIQFLRVFPRFVEGVRNARDFECAHWVDAETRRRRLA